MSGLGAPRKHPDLLDAVGELWRYWDLPVPLDCQFQMEHQFRMEHQVMPELVGDALVARPAAAAWQMPHCRAELVLPRQVADRPPDCAAVAEPSVAPLCSPESCSPESCSPESCSPESCSPERCWLELSLTNPLPLQNREPPFPAVPGRPVFFQVMFFQAAFFRAAFWLLPLCRVLSVAF